MTSYRALMDNATSQAESWIVSLKRCPWIARQRTWYMHLAGYPAGWWSRRSPYRQCPARTAAPEPFMPGHFRSRL